MLPAHHKQHVDRPQVCEGTYSSRKVCGDCNLLGSAEQADDSSHRMCPAIHYGLYSALQALAAAPQSAGYVPRCHCSPRTTSRQHALTQALHHAHDVALAVLTGAQHGAALQVDVLHCLVGWAWQDGTRCCQVQVQKGGEG